MSSLIHNSEIVLGGTKFRVEQVSDSYYKLVPIDDPLWLLRFCEQLAPRSGNPDGTV